MKFNFVYTLLLGSALVVSCQDNGTTDGSPLDSPFEVFEYVTASGRTYIPNIDDTDRNISIYGVEHSEDIVAVNYQLKEGLSILPAPESRLGEWREQELFVLSDGESKIPYEVNLVDFYHEFVEKDAVIYTQQPYGAEVKYHLYDLKADTKTNQLDTYANAEVMFQEYGMCGVRLPIWGATDPITGEYGHPMEGVVNPNVYGRTYRRTKNALAAYMAGGGNKSDFIVFISIKSSGNDPVRLPSWCFKNGEISRANLLPDKYATLIEDLTKALKANVDSDLQVQVVGLDNESSLGDCKAGTAWMHYETVPYIKKRFAANGWATPQFISYEAWEPKKFVGGMFQKILSQAPETVDIYGIHYYSEKDHPKNFNNLEDDWDAAITNPVYAKPDGKERVFWASEPHWMSPGEVMNVDKYQEDFFKLCEQSMCTIWAQTDLGMTAFCWWGFSVGTGLRNHLMRITSVPLVGCTPVKFIDHDDEGFSKDATTSDDVTRDYVLGSNNLKTRAFIKGNKVVLYLLNVDWFFNVAAGTAPSYTDYKIGLADATIKSSKISYEMFTGDGTNGTNFTQTVDEITVTPGSDYFEFDIPARSITCIEFEVEFNTAAVD